MQLLENVYPGLLTSKPGQLVEIYVPVPLHCEEEGSLSNGAGKAAENGVSEGREGERGGGGGGGEEVNVKEEEMNLEVIEGERDSERRNGLEEEVERDGPRADEPDSVFVENSSPLQVQYALK